MVAKWDKTCLRVWEDRLADSQRDEMFFQIIEQLIDITSQWKNLDSQTSQTNGGVMAGVQGETAGGDNNGENNENQGG